MDDYRDQEVWFEVEGETDPGHWEFIGDADTQHDAEGIQAEYAQLDPDLNTRVRKVSGLPA